MKQSGHIEIKDNKVIFVYYELEKPRKDDYNIQLVGVVAGNIVENEGFRDRDYLKAMKEYKASKRSVEASNILISPYKHHESFCHARIETVKCLIKNNQHCEAKVENGIATITKIT